MAPLKSEPLADSLPMIINFMACRTDTQPEQQSMSWSDLCKLLTTPPSQHGALSMQEYQAADHDTKKREKDHSGWIPGSLKEQAHGRKQTNIAKLYCVVLDCDSGISFEEARAKLKGWEAVLHTTYSHTTENPKFRAVLPVRQPVEPDQVGALFDFMNQQFDGKLDKSCMEPARFFYLPSCPPDMVASFKAAHLSGQFLSLDDAAGKLAPLSLAASIPVAAPTTSAAPHLPVKLATVHGVAVGSRNSELSQLVGRLINDGLDMEAAKEYCLVWNATLSTPLNELEVRRTVKSVYQTAERKAKVSEVELAKIIQGMNRSYAFLTDTARIVRLEDRCIQSFEMMRHRYANTFVLITDGDRTKKLTHFDAWMQSPDRREHLGFTFQPGADLIVDNCINQWTGWNAKPVAGNVQPWNDFLDYVFGAGTIERRYAEQWIAYPFQNPGAKLHTSMIIWSTRHGVGKSMLGESVSLLYGRHAKTITATELHDKNNSWAEDALFVLGEENASNDRRADSNRLKHLITGDKMFIHEKYQVGREAQNRLNFMFTSNHPNAFHLEIHDRRFFVVAIDSLPKPAEYYKSFADWRDAPGSMDALMDHLLTLDMTDFNPNADAPLTRAKLEMVEQSKTETESWLTDLLTDECIDGHLGSEVVAINDLVDRHNKETGAGRANATAVGRALRRMCNYEQKRVLIGKKRANLISLRNHDHWRDQDGSAWAAEYVKGKKFMSLSL